MKSTIIGLIAGLLIATGLMVFDEILTLAIYYCSGFDPQCLYPIPFLGRWRLYDAESFAWVLILGGITTLIVGIALERRARFSVSGTP